MELSEQSRRFIENLRVYLLPSNKNEEEIHSIIEELTDHLVEAEAQGKSVDHIIGSSPKEYMKELEKELSFDIKSWSKFGPIIFIGGIALIVLSTSINGGVSYSWFHIVGIPFATILSISLYKNMFHFFGTSFGPIWKEVSMSMVYGMVPVILYAIVLLLDLFFGKPVFTPNTTENAIIIGIAIFTILSLSITYKQITLFIASIILTLPSYLSKIWNISEPQSFYLEIGLIYSGFFLYILFIFLYHKGKEKRDSSASKLS